LRCLRGFGRGAIVVNAALLASVMEASKLFAQGARADPGNVGISAVAVWVTEALSGRLFAMCPATPPSGMH
jgi:hypothetical protein